MKELIGQSRHLQLIRKRIREISQSRSPVIIVGETGVGKSVIAENIHESSQESGKPFVYLNISLEDELRLRALVQSLLEQRLFINPSTSDHGNFVLPFGTTIIIEGIETSSPAAKSILANLLDEFRKEDYGIRLIVLLTKPVREFYNDDDSLRDFWKLLETWDSLVVPSLRERQEDIPELIEYFVRQTAKELNLGEVIVDINAVGILVRREWKGNIQELKTFVEQAMILSSGQETFTLPENLVDEHSELTQVLHKIDEGIDFALDRSMEFIERKILERVLMKFSFNQSRAARFLKITEDTLRYRMKKLGIPTSASHG